MAFDGKYRSSSCCIQTVDRSRKLKYSVLEGTDEDISWVYYTLEKDVEPSR